ncbi:Stk1 family PASTA domain-containing Ser/Thr kinase [Pseudonocardia sp. KRD-184]|uniref:non-specific serine/threonine protein kinase n=1 Tax=Pseudonocardia oceani TaxID=2792013 RepID=A0ABS6U9Q2_9PSEU|nr:Stk1 family PASTA domain-containing Ser/Thr kinase [Pseudonocardia oceani]MBW0095885.1 Stk1 family PASTA domain-containing Ser/Thr kinase [Pseudonocardia oceani]MBW0108476.1 Stk1 family PASTA domain-containing Ser/Thr kinase [Pseudonocardia oceani]MBW0122622.1 Stk1 family PASTA domain-containing Ser/Thr kinase [Pseudonocardia oceani]MBW0128884.1 Stk1 family PASTA domain-containing Ser/Thr kinase [Pseudonocardia oceani]
MTTPRLLSERYELGDTLGYGGMSEVHHGLDTRLGRDVAIKVLRADLARDPQFQMRFRREAQNAAALNHPAIVAVYDTGEVQSEFGPLPYIVMEFVDGQTLREIVKTTGPMSQQRVIEVMADVCAALDFSHRHQIIHRDVKPANIMINNAGAVKVMDFGIARALGEGQNVTQTAAVIGTAQYLSPEQARGEAVDARSDVYAAGCVLFELLTGEPPFTGDTPVAVAYQHVREDPRHPSELNPEIPAALDSVVLKALSKNPANRYQSAAEMRSDLVRVRSGQTVMAPAVMSEDERTAMLASQTGPTRRINGGRHTLPPSAPAYYDDEEPRRNTGRIVGIAAAVAIALALIGFVAYQIFGGPAAPEQFAMPDVVGQEQEAARTALINLSLNPTVQAEESSVDDQGRVVRTDPPATSLVEERRAVTLFVGSGPAVAAVPPLAGLTITEAETALAARGLTLGEQTPEETRDEALIDKIIRSTPAAGADAPGGSAVAVVVGTRPTTVAVPDVTGQGRDQARSALEAAGFEVAETEVDGGGESGDVLGTNPAAGTQVAPGSTVTLQLSRGNQVQVPDLVGLDRSDALRALQQAGISLSDVDQRERDVSDNSQDGRVIEQSVAPGQSLEDGDELTITIGDAGGGFFGGN